jgi:hypothetical protein
VDLKRLAEFALLGSSGSEQYAILLVRVSLGLFFARNIHCRYSLAGKLLE